MLQFLFILGSVTLTVVHIKYSWKTTIEFMYWNTGIHIAITAFLIFYGLLLLVSEIARCYGCRACSPWLSALSGLRIFCCFAISLLLISTFRTCSPFEDWVFLTDDLERSMKENMHHYNENSTWGQLSNNLKFVLHLECGFFNLTKSKNYPSLMLSY